MGTDERRKVIHCGRLIDGVADEAAGSSTVVVRGNRIESIGPRGAASAAGDVVDLGSLTVLPGLIDLHAHVMHEPLGDSFGSFLRGSSARKTLYGLWRAQGMLRLGFTTLRDPGDVDRYFGLVELRDAIARGHFVGPRLLVAPHALTPTGGHADLNELASDIPPDVAGRIVSGPDSMREVVRDEIKYGADWIKLYVSGGVMSARDDPRIQTFTDDEIRAGVDEAHRLHRKVSVHAHGTQSIKTSVRAGVDSVEHGSFIDDEGIRLMVEHRVGLVPTIYTLKYILEEGAAQGIPEERIAKARAVDEARIPRLRAAAQAGVPIAFGSDTIFPIEYSPREFWALEEIGLTPMQSIRSATRNAATILGLQGDLGTLEPGKIADLIAVRGDPLENLRHMENVVWVMKDGVVVKNELE